jgi:hypothetical protein
MPQTEACWKFKLDDAERYLYVHGYYGADKRVLAEMLLHRYGVVLLERINEWVLAVKGLDFTDETTRIVSKSAFKGANNG